LLNGITAAVALSIRKLCHAVEGRGQVDTIHSLEVGGDDLQERGEVTILSRLGDQAIDRLGVAGRASGVVSALLMATIGRLL
jgi:hypothetical protein